MPSPIDNPLLEAALENAEVAADLLTSNEVLREIPVVGTALNIIRGVRDVRERIFAHKLERFIAGLKTPQAKEKIKAKIRSSPEATRKVGETLVLVLDRITDLDKPALLARIFVAFLDEVISDSELRRLAQSLDNAFAEDIQRLIEESNPYPDHRHEWMENLLSSGLTRTQVIDGAIGAGARIVFEVSPLGVLMQKALAHGPPS